MKKILIIILLALSNFTIAGAEEVTSQNSQIEVICTDDKLYEENLNKDGEFMLLAYQDNMGNYYLNMEALKEIIFYILIGFFFFMTIITLAIKSWKSGGKTIGR